MGRYKIKSGEFYNILSLIQEKRFAFWIALLYHSVSYPLFQIIFSLLNKKLFNAVEFSSMELLKEAFILAAVLLFLTCFFEPISGYLFEKQLFRTMTQIKLRLFTRLNKLPTHFFDANHSGDIMAIVNNDAELLRRSYLAFSKLILMATYALGCAITMLSLNWKLGLLIISICAVTSVINKLYLKPIRALGNQVQQHVGKLTEKFSDILSGVLLIKIFGMAKIRERFTAENNLVAQLSISSAQKNAQLNSTNFMLTVINLLGALFAGAYMIANHSTDLGTVVALVTLQTELSEMFLGFGGGLARLQSSLAGASRVLSLFKQPVEPEHSTYKRTALNDEMLTFSQVKFGYNKENMVLGGIDLVVKAGETIALVGSSGGGKSTLLKIIMGLYVPESGEIAINRSAKTGLESIRDLIAYVPQEVFLFNGTIFDNIVIGKIGASKKQVIEAAKAANAHEFIMSLENQYETEVGEKGTLLSGGQKQRIAIARAILKDAPLLLLDEATSALDSTNEELVLQVLRQLKQTKTIIMVAHRLSTIKEADRTYWIEKGKVKEYRNYLEFKERLEYIER